jgi:serine/threonine-protein kinase
MAMRARFLLSTLIFALPPFLLAAQAQAVPPADEAAADVLFNQASEAAIAGRFDEACPKFAEAQRLDPTAGTLLNLAKCEIQRGNLATAYGAYVTAISLAEHDDDKKGRVAFAREAASKLAPKLPMLVIAVAPESRAEGLEIKRNGKLVGAGQWGSRVPMDPGAITIEATAPGRTTWTTTIRIESKPGETRVDVPSLTAAVVPSAAPAPDASVAPAPAESAWSGQKTAAVVVAGAGLIGVVLGSVFGVQAISKNGSSKDHCLPSTPNLCDATGVDLRVQTKTATTLSTVGFAVGGAALVGGVVLYLTAPSKDKAKTTGTARVELAPVVIGSGGGLVLQGSW